MNRSSLLVLILSLASLLVAACVKPEKGEDTDSATFVVKDIGSKSVYPEIDQEQTWKVASAVKITFQATVKERTSRVDVMGQYFTVEKPDGTKFPDNKSDPYGQFTWTETIPYNPFAKQSGYVELKRVIVGQGANIGRYNVSIYVDPWAVGDHPRDTGQVIIFNREGSKDLDPAKIFPERKTFEALAGAIQGQSQIWAPKSKVRGYEVGRPSTGPRYRITFDSELKIKYLDASGMPHYPSMPDGDVLVRFQLLATNVGGAMDKTITLLTGGQNFWRGHVYDGELSIDFNTQQVQLPNTANLRALVEIRPMGMHNNETVRPFTGVYDLGEGSTLKSEQTGTLTQECRDLNPSCEYMKVINRADNVEELRKQGYVRDPSPYLFTPLKLRFVSVQPGETTTQRTVIYSAKTCITYLNTGKAARNTPVKISYLPTMVQNTKYNRPDGPEQTEEDPKNPRMVEDEFDGELPVPPSTTDDDGCIAWNGHAFHHYYWPETFFYKTVKIQIGEDQHVVEPDGAKVTYPAFEQKLSFYLNPWDPGFTFGFDSQEFTAKFDGPKTVSRFFLGDYSYHTVRFLYHVDPYLNLEVQKWILLEIVPQVLRYSSISNARKAVEKLRDGIYLMKVAIEKSYLDPRDNSGWLLPQQPELQSHQETVGEKQVVGKSYVTTNSTLVRVVDGVIIYPLSLTMRDLRLMRVRSNFLIQLENVDERLVQAYHVYRERELRRANERGQQPDGRTIQDAFDNFRKVVQDNPRSPEIEKLLRSEAYLPEMERTNKDRADFAAAEDMRAATEALDQKVFQVQQSVRTELDKLKDIFNNGGQILEELDDKSKGTGKILVLQNGQVINDKFKLHPDMLKDLAKVLRVNDFSKVTLPKSTEVDLDTFVDQNSGLEKRTFVGPVIFLSNAYGDSMRATDNLDETGCNPNMRADLEKMGIKADLLTLSEKALEDIYNKSPTLLTQSAPFSGRDQNIYRYNDYFNAYDHLCDKKVKQVDDLIEEEKVQKVERENRDAAASLPYNFVDRYNMDYISMTDEPLMKINPVCAERGKDGSYNNCAGSVVNYMVSTKTVPVHYYNPNCSGTPNHCEVVDSRPVMSSNDLMKYMNQNWWIDSGRNFDLGLFFSHLGFKAWQSWNHDRIGTWSKDDMSRFIFGETLNAKGEPQSPKRALFSEESKEAICNAVVNKVYDNLTEAVSKGMVKASRVTPALWASLQWACWRKGPMHELKYRNIGQTGQYTFLGGLNLNVNVGEGFSFGTSTGWSGGIDIMDSVNAGSGLMMSSGPSKVVSNVTKPFSLKYGESMGSSEGTSVSLSTYLVAQILGMDVMLNHYEKCATMGLGREAIDYLFALDKLDDQAAKDKNFISGLTRGIFVCEGATRERNNPTTVPESYFYFTQHFTEGDMLDQADLYNHPWLLALRGMRDYKVFSDRVRKQEVETFGSFKDYVFNERTPRADGWPLLQLEQSYKDTSPTFPGYYSVLEEGQQNIDEFALNQANPNADDNNYPAASLTKADFGNEVERARMRQWNSVQERKLSERRFGHYKPGAFTREGPVKLIPREDPVGH